MIRRRLVVTGRVQGVFYRGWFVGRMTELGVRGWIRNRADRSVEAVVEWPAALVDAAIATARQGSPASRVDDVVVSEDAPAEVFAIFEQRATI
jgi:acylphosphatase